MSDRLMNRLMFAILLAAVIAAAGWWAYDKVHEPSERECRTAEVNYYVRYGSLDGFDKAGC